MDVYQLTTQMKMIEEVLQSDYSANDMSVVIT